MSEPSEIANAQLIQAQLQIIQEKIEQACQSARRQPNEIHLVAVSKTFPAQSIQAAYQLGCRVFGESKLQEFLQKYESLPKDIEWHFIGRLQRNKLRKILNHFSVLHSVDSLEMLHHIDQLAYELKLKPKIFLQVNLGKEASKTGFEPSDLLANIEPIMACKHVDYAGLMCIPPYEMMPEKAKQWFQELKNLRDLIVSKSQLNLHYLSMGMSEDFSEAIQEGATHIRIGSAIFGSRQK